MKAVVSNIAGAVLFPFGALVVFESIGILIESLIVVSVFKRWRAKMTSLRLVGAIVLANMVSLVVGYIFVAILPVSWWGFR